MAQQHGRRRTGSGGKASVGGRKGSAGSNRPAGKTGGYSGRPSQSASQRPTQHRTGGANRGTSNQRGILTSLLGSLGSSSSSSSSSGSMLTGIFSLLKKNKTARIIALILVAVIIFWLISNGGCNNLSCGSLLGSSGSSDISDYLGIAGSTSSEQDADLSVSNDAREKYTSYPSSDATMTIMVYMCGTDLESNHGMATSDLQEMIAADISSNVNIIVETGGTQKWNNKNISSSKNQRYKVTSDGLTLLEDLKKKSMVEPETLTDFIDFCTENYEADRYALIFWDHGGGSVSGYGYDQHFPNGSMTLDEIDDALSAAGCKFDFIGFDACLMATLETAMVAERYADYLIASEETEPGVGWYYTEWLNTLSEDTSISTVELGKSIVDSFVEECARKTPGSKTTLSVIDLAELAGTVPEAFNEFAVATSELIENDDYKQISNARSATREFSDNIDQVDFIDLCERIGTSESKALAKALENCVKYNRTSSNITNANGVSIYFPYGKSSAMSSALKTYDKIGLDDAYGDCIKEFASVTAGGQIANGGGADLMGSLFESMLGGSSSSSSSGSLGDIISLFGGSSSSSSSNTELIGTVLDLFLKSNSSKALTGIDVGQEEDWFDADKVSEYESYITENYLDPDHIVITENEKGQKVVSLTEEEWDLVQSIELNVFYDDGEGYIDLGMDSIFERDEETGDLYIDYDGMWITIEGQVVSYYMLSEQWSDDGEEYVITGYVPAMLNDAQVEIIVVFDSQKEYGEVVGYRPVYEDALAPVAKTVTEFADGDRIDLICDFYSYDQSYDDSYLFGDTIVVDGELKVRDAELDLEGGKVLYSYCLTDIYGNQMWTAQTEYTGE